MSETLGLNHLGLAVRNLDRTTDFLVDVLGWEETARDKSYPRNSMTDGHMRLTLWQVREPDKAVDFDRRANIGLHHLALTVATEADLIRLSERISNWPGVDVEFMPELLGKGPRKHMMFAEPGGIRIELIWQGQ